MFFVVAASYLEYHYFPLLLVDHISLLQIATTFFYSLFGFLLRGALLIYHIFVRINFSLNWIVALIVIKYFNFWFTSM
jgi:hypothetical protein